MAKISTIDEAYNFSIAMKAQGWNNLDTVSRLKEQLNNSVTLDVSEDGTMTIFYFSKALLIFLPNNEVVQWAVKDIQSEFERTYKEPYEDSPTSEGSAILDPLPDLEPIRETTKCCLCEASPASTEDLCHRCEAAKEDRSGLQEFFDAVTSSFSSKPSSPE